LRIKEETNSPPLEESDPPAIVMRVRSAATRLESGKRKTNIRWNVAVHPEKFAHRLNSSLLARADFIPFIKPRRIRRAARGRVQILCRWTNHCIASTQGHRIWPSEESHTAETIPVPHPPLTRRGPGRGWGDSRGLRPLILPNFLFLRHQTPPALPWSGEERRTYPPRHQQGHSRDGLPLSSKVKCDGPEL
jgi:hypothetical protein